MAVKTKAQNQTDINADATLTANQKVILSNLVDSYEDVFPNLTTIQRNLLTPTAGLIVYNTDNNRYEYWNGTAWMGIGQDLSTPMTVKVDLSNADLLALNATPKTLVAAPGAGFAILPSSLAYRYTRGSASFTGSYFVCLKCSTKSTSHPFTSIADTLLNAAANRSGSNPANTGTSIDALAENDSIELKSTAAIATGDGAVTVWLTYSLITW